MARIESSDSRNEAKFLLVEGPSDEHVVRHICNQHPEIPDFYIQDRGNVNGVLASIDPELRSPGRVALGILVDADDAPQSRWKEVASRLRRAGIPPTPAPDVEGTVIDGGRPCVGIWLMPDNRAAGEVEDFVSQMIPDGDPVWPLAQNYIDGIPEADRKFALGKTSRAQIYAWLAARAAPRMMGSAIGTHDLETDGELCQKFVAWLTRLFK